MTTVVASGWSSQERRIELLRINSAGVIPVVVFSTVFMIHCTMGGWSYDHALCTRTSKRMAFRCRNTSWFARSTMAFSTPDNRKSCLMSSLWKAGPLSVCTNSGAPNRPKCWKTHVAVLSNWWKKAQSTAKRRQWGRGCIRIHGRPSWVDQCYPNG